MRELIVALKETIPLWMKVSIGFIMAFAITAITIPTIVRVARLKDLSAKPNGRTSHSSDIPNLGGMALFSAFLIAVLMIAGDSLTSDLFYVICGLLILFFTGMKDDILIIDPKKKLALQLLVAAIIAVMADMKIDNLFEIFNIGSITYIPSVVLTIFIILLVINGFNLIDGIDGLAAGIGILASTFFGMYFWSFHEVSYTIICFSLAGSLSGFFIYNVFGSTNKIFLGDTGSLILGLTISVLMIKFLKPANTGPGKLPQASPALAAAVLILPLFDTIRIFIIRIIQGKSPFAADHQHVHHLLLHLGLSHLKSTLILLSFNISMVVVCLFLSSIGDLPLILIIFGVAEVSAFLLRTLEHRRMLKIEMIKIQLRETIKASDPEPQPEEAEVMNV